MGSPDLLSYDRIIIAFSGGKDSLACLLHLIESGVPLERIELRHHEVDGREGGWFMDWPSTPSYCRAIAAALGVKLLFSWKEGGFEREMLRNAAPTAPTHWEVSDGTILSAGGSSGKLGTRMKFPQVAADLSCRWCSAYLKIDVLCKVLANSPEYQKKRLLVVTGERAEESPSRAKYQTFEQSRSHAPQRGRHVDHWRPVHGWSTTQVWEIIRRHGVVPHPAYSIGWGRLSCMTCIFGSRCQWATIRQIAPARFEKIAAYEKQFGRTIHRKESVGTLADAGAPYEAARGPMVAAALSEEFTGPAVVAPESWVEPAGAYGENAGPS